MPDLLPSLEMALFGGVAIAGGELIRRLIGRVWLKLIDPGLDRRLEVRRVEQARDATLAEIAAQFTENGGSSLHDRVVQLESGQARIEGRLQEAHGLAASNNERLTELADSVGQVLDAVTRPDAA